MTTTTTQKSNPLIKQLAANDRRTRDRAVESLRTYLRSRAHFDETELLKLWKGLFYCMWMSDKPRTQQQLARDLAGLVDVVPEATVIPYLDAFWKTMAREWSGIDVLRMDKFLYLVRQYLAASFRHFARSGWMDTDAVEKYMEVLATTPLHPRDRQVPDGLRYHVVDIYVDELDKVDAQREGRLPLEQLLRPLRELAARSPVKSVRTRVKEALDDERLRDWQGQGQHESEGGSDDEDGGGHEVNYGKREASNSGDNEDEDNDDDEWGGIED